MEMVNNQGFSMLHLAAFNNATKCFNEIIAQAEEEAKLMDVEQRMLQAKNWIDLKTKSEQFTALHYASYRGNIKICRVLHSLGADCTLVNI